MPKKLDFKNLRLCIDNYPADSLHIRLVSSMGGTLKVNEKLGGRTLDFRIEPTEDGIGRMIMLSQGIDPYDPGLPEPERSILRTVLDRHLMQIGFEGRVNLKFHSWWIEPHWKYWIIDKPGNIQETILKQQIEYEEDS